MGEELVFVFLLEPVRAMATARFAAVAALFQEFGGEYDESVLDVEVDAFDQFWHMGNPVQSPAASAAPGCPDARK